MINFYDKNDNCQISDIFQKYFQRFSTVQSVSISPVSASPVQFNIWNQFIIIIFWINSVSFSSSRLF